MSNNGWQSHFQDQFLRLVAKRKDASSITVEQAFREFQRSDEKIKQSFWITMGSIMKVTPKQLHDYYHNTWSKRFFDDLTPYKLEIQEIIDNTKQTYPSMNKKEMIRTIIHDVQQRHPGAQFHYQTIYQFVNYKIASNSSVKDSKYRTILGAKSIIQIPQHITEELDTQINEPGNSQSTILVPHTQISHTDISQTEDATKQLFSSSLPDTLPDLSSLQFQNQPPKLNFVNPLGVTQEISASDVFSMQPSTSCVEMGKIEESESCINDCDNLFDFQTAGDHFGF